MNEQYVHGFAQAYDEHWQLYPSRIGPELLRLHQHVAPDAERRVLDIGCGTGLVASHFQQAGYQVAGLDVSKAMLDRARTRLGDDALLVHGDAADFALYDTYPYALSTYDIPTTSAIRR